MLLVLFCIHVNHLCTLYLYSFLAVVWKISFFFLLNVLPSENKDYIKTIINVIAFSCSSKCLNTQYAVLSGAMVYIFIYVRKTKFIFLNIQSTLFEMTMFFYPSSL